MAERNGRRLDDREAVITAQLRRGLARTEDRLYRDLEAVTDRILEARALGTPTSPAWLYQQSRYRELIAQVDQQMAAYGGEAARSITETQRWAALEGTTDAASMAGQAAGIRAEFLGTNPANALAAVGFSADGTPLAELFAAMGEQAAANAGTVLTQAAVLGWGTAKIAREFQRVTTGMARHRSETIARTEMHRVYRAASRDTYYANADVVQGWMWRAHIDSRTCPACIVMDGTMHPVEDTLDGHPRCRCAMIPVTIPLPGMDATAVRDARKGAEWLKAQDAGTQDRILGPTKGDLLRRGQIDTQDLVRRVDDPTWGTTRREATIAEARASAAARGVTQTISPRTTTPGGQTRRKTRQEVAQETAGIRAQVPQARAAQQPRAGRPTAVPANGHVPTPAPRLPITNGWDRWTVNRDLHVHNGQPVGPFRLESARNKVASLESVVESDRAQVVGSRANLANIKARREAAIQRMRDANAPADVIASARRGGKQWPEFHGLKNAEKYERETLARWERSLAKAQDDLVEAQGALKALQAPAVRVAPDYDPTNPLAMYGDRLVVSDQARKTAEHLHDLETNLPAGHHTLLRDHYLDGPPGGGFYVGQEVLPDLDDLGHLKGHQPRGWDQGRTWNEVGGVYSPFTRTNAVSREGWRSKSTDGTLEHATAIHEAGHALDHAHETLLGMPTTASQSPMWQGLGTAGQGLRLRAYYTPRGNPTGWQSEMWAESFDGWATGLRYGSPEERAQHLLHTLGGPTIRPTGWEPTEMILGGPMDVLVDDVAAALEPYAAIVRYFDDLDERLQQRMAGA